MSHFYGKLQGSRGEATRCGSKKSGMTTHCASYHGAVRCYAYYDEATDTDMVEVMLVPWHGAGHYQPLYTGPMGGPREKEEGGVANV